MDYWPLCGCRSEESVLRLSRRLLAVVSFLPMLAASGSFAVTGARGEAIHPSVAPLAGRSSECIAPGASHAASVKKQNAPPRKLRPRERVAAGDKWRVLVSRLQIQMPQPEWPKPEAWLFAATGVENTEDGARFIVTATREGDSRPQVRLYLDPKTQAIMRADIVVPARGSERVFTERRTAGEPFACEMCPVPVAQVAGAPVPTRNAGKAEEAVAPSSKTNDSSSRTKDSGPVGSPKPPEATGDNHQPTTSNGELTGGFSFGGRLKERTEPVDAGVGRAMIRRGLSPLNLPRGTASEPFGVPRVLTVIEGPGLQVEQVWDETTPWPLYSQTDTSRSWLVAYTKGKSP
jgi:hypothetical protein